MIHYISDLVWLETAGLHLLLGEESLPRLLHDEDCQMVSEPLRHSGARAVFIQTEMRG